MNTMLALSAGRKFYVRCPSALALIAMQPCVNRHTAVDMEKKKGPISQHKSY